LAKRLSWHPAMTSAANTIMPQQLIVFRIEDSMTHPFS
jgi:hypothetical protein